MEKSFEFPVVIRKADNITVSINWEEFSEAGNKRQKEKYIKKLIKRKQTNLLEIKDCKINEIKDFFMSQPDVPDKEFFFPVSIKEERDVEVEIDIEKFIDASEKKEQKEYIEKLIKEKYSDVLKIKDYKIREIKEFFEDIMDTSDMHPNESCDEYMENTNHDN